MIGRIKGKLLDKSPPIILVDCQGVGYELEVPMTTFYELPEIGNDVTLLTHFIVREDAQLLFGFGSEQERKIFKQLIKVNGIGAKVALSILSGISLNELMKAINHSESDLLVKIPGIGKKTADRLVLELKDKFKDIPSSSSTSKMPSQLDDIQNALIGLGYSQKDATTIVRELPDEISVNDGIRQALKMLSKNL
ncbi:MAG TPA: Holliday junction branch migration protein RuvA [Methylophilaceae bacterium]|jgi:holliday junction DNA helicase RuvA|nr:Holliday junction branch migration protein RuvA [Methylophilaceae bacterium]|tara:strand:+ start:2261 stop:2842 length:582 start_codon:yes stop_codon:yes gene_type:complete